MRTSLCLGCRTALAPGEDCDACGSKEVVSLVEGDGRARACKAAWTQEQVEAVRPPSTLLRLAFMGLVGVTLVAVVAATVWATLQYGALGFLGGAGGGALLVLVVLLSPMSSDAEAHTREGEIFMRPKGTWRWPKPDAALARVTGQLRASNESNEVGATLLELALSNGEITLRDAVSTGFTVELGDGRSVAVPAGRVRVHAGKRALDSMPRRELRKHLVLLDPSRERSKDDPFPVDRPQILELRSGDRVTVAAPAFDESWEGDSGYRVGSGITMRPRGFVWLLPE